tara:strand:- start:121 stop:1041 length:921 start_codon:yes stop_codon:yes gene_type:complete
MVNKPLISIIIPSYNHGHLIGRALKSILDQTYTNWEAIIVDNSSKDDTENIVLSFLDSRIKFHKINNKGVIASSRNLGIKKAIGEWIAFLDSDDWWKPEKLDTVLKSMSNDCDLIFHNLKIVKNKSFLFSKSIGSYDSSLTAFENLLFQGNLIPNSSVIVKKIILQEVNLISEDVSKISWEDYDCWLKISKISNNFSYIDKDLGFYWLGDNTSNPKRTLKNLESIYLEYFSPLRNPPPFWFSYSLGANLLKCGHYKDSFKILQKISLKNINFLNKLKYCVRFIQSLILRLKPNLEYENMKKFTYLQ